MFGFSATEIIIFAAILVLLFGSKKIPQLARSIGETIRYIRKGFSDDKKEDTDNKTNKKD